MKNSEYQNAKQELKQTAKQVKKHYPNDKPLIRESINNRAYFLEYNLTPHQIELLHNYACKLHP